MEYVTRCGETVPKIGLGTWQMDDRQAYESVSTALELGYRHIDTAQYYENELAVGDAIADAAVDRDDLFLTTKVKPTNRTVEAIVDSTEESLKRLGVDQVDLLLIHWPNPLAKLKTVMRGLNEARSWGLTRHIGVSNFSKKRLAKARKLSDAPVFTNQVLFHPWWPQRELLAYCQRHDIVLTAYSPLATGGAVDDDLLWELGERYAKTGPQVALRWVTQHENVVTIPKSTSRGHLRENMNIFDFALTRDEHDRVTRPSYLGTGLAMLRAGG